MISSHPPPPHPPEPSSAPQTPAPMPAANPSPTTYPLVPFFRVISISNTIAYSTFLSTLPLLPLLLPPSTPLVHVALILSAFTFPSILIHPLIFSKHYAPALSLTITIGVFLQAAGSLLLAIFLLLLLPVQHAHPIPQTTLTTIPLVFTPSSRPLLLAFCIALIGLGAVLTHSSLMRFVDARVSRLPLRRRRRIIGIHCAALEACISVGNMTLPLVFALLVIHPLNVSIPYLLFGVMQFALAVYIACILPDDEPSIPVIAVPDIGEVDRVDEMTRLARTSATGGGGYGAVRGGVDHVRQKTVIYGVRYVERSGTGQGSERGVLFALRHAWVWVVLFCNVMMAGSMGFLRVGLARAVEQEGEGGRLYVAGLFSLCGFVGVVGESVGTMVAGPRIGERKTAIGGIVICLVGYGVLSKGWGLMGGVVLVAGGASVALVMTVTDLAKTTGIEVDGVVNCLSLMTGVMFGIGEILGMVGGGWLYDVNGSLAKAAEVWHRLLGVGCALVMGAYAVGVMAHCIRPGTLLRSGVGQSEEVQRREPVRV